MRTEQRNFFVWKKKMEQKKEMLEHAKKDLAEKIKRQAQVSSKLMIQENQDNAAQISDLKVRVKDKKTIYSKHQDLM